MYFEALAAVCLSNANGQGRLLREVPTSAWHWWIENGLRYCVMTRRLTGYRTRAWCNRTPPPGTPLPPLLLQASSSDKLAMEGGGGDSGAGAGGWSGGGGGGGWWREDDPYWPLRDWGDHPMRWWTLAFAAIMAGAQLGGGPHHGRRMGRRLVWRRIWRGAQLCTVAGVGEHAGEHVAHGSDGSVRNLLSRSRMHARTWHARTAKLP